MPCKLAVCSILFLLFSSFHRPASTVPVEWSRPDADCLPSSAASALNSSVSVFPEHARAKVEYAADFTLEYRSTYKVLRNTWRDETYILHQCGTEKPSIHEEFPGAKHFSIPLNAVSAPDTTLLDFVNLLGVHDRVRWASEFSSAPCMQYLSSPIGCGHNANNPIWADEAVPEVDLADAFFVWSKDVSNRTISFTASRDHGALERAEWLKFVAAFFNKEDNANIMFEQLVRNYNQYKLRAAEAVSNHDGELPVVAWLLYRSGLDTVRISNAAYKVDLTQDAGARIMNATLLARDHGAELGGDDVNPSAQFNISNAEHKSSFVKALEKVDILVDETMFNHYGVDHVDDMNMEAFIKTLDLEDERDSIPFLSANKLLRVEGSISVMNWTDSHGMDWLERGISRPDIVLADLVRAVHQAAGHHRADLIYNVKLDEPRTLSAQSCEREQVTGSCNRAKASSICPYTYQHNDHLFHVRPFEGRCSPAAPEQGVRPIGATRTEGDCLSEDVASLLNSTVSVFPEHVRVQVDKASEFTVEYHSTYKVVTNTVRDERYVLYQCGAPVGQLEQEYPDAKLFEIPLASVATPSTTVLGFLELLGVTDRIRYTSTWATNACLQHLASNAGCDKNAVDPTDDSFELLQLAEQQEQVDAFFVWSASHNKKTVAFTSTRDGGPLSRAEWIKFVALFFNKEELANRLFDQIVRNYEESVLSGTRAVQENNGERPVMGWMRYLDFYGPKEAILSFSAYRSSYAQDSGARLLDKAEVAGKYPEAVKQDGDDLKFDLEDEASRSALRSVLMQVDIMIDTTYYANYGVDSVADINVDHFLDLFRLQNGVGLPFIDNQKLYRNDGTVNENMGLDWFEKGVARPDIVLADFLRATHQAAGHHTAEIVRSVFHDAPHVVEVESCSNDRVLEGCNEALPPAICPYTFKHNDHLFHVRPFEDRCSPAAPEQGVRPIGSSTSFLLITFIMRSEMASRLGPGTKEYTDFERTTVDALETELHHEREQGSGLPSIELVDISASGGVNAAAAGGKRRVLQDNGGTSVVASYQVTVRGASRMDQASEDAARLSSELNSASKEELRQMFDGNGLLDSFMERFGITGVSSTSTGPGSNPPGKADATPPVGSNEGNTSTGLSGGDIAGIVVGVVIGLAVVVALVAVIAMVAYRHEKRRQLAGLVYSLEGANNMSAPSKEGKEGKEGHLQVTVCADGASTPDFSTSGSSDNGEAQQKAGTKEGLSGV
ncbi:hypothetical protein DUNSADRAFT_9920 [Dunaliella salina]|uniref:Uncharacterized protein n=1 Tax=Dunaliella salina TaxID=3046 RepID=A0ABQ7GGJ0_DUNSA|nr:hypothetical protein DUNSADRAFT_9920 [Dunaliella salina]|eukprot:KAF5833722.1 hypothetical protein DUNSADRAFT_9920 [Dunaliella salina]